ncbi:J domain-containing protein [Streptomyces sp. HNM0575]|uniref:J domain-containing protein n=1 Tax=Streptomyces sp. HNM0575 TaxID=2716338 RepID=UPI001F0D5205|nr:J domain-containing protein [Streptomyces sp. HNM0575]
MRANPEAEAEEPEQPPERQQNGPSGAEAGAEAGAGTGAEAGSGTGAEAGSERAEPGTDRLEKAVRAAETALIEFEIAVETFRVEIENFSRLHHQRLGPMYARLDELDAAILETTAAITGDAEDLRKAQEARAAVLPMPKVEELFHGWIDSEGLPPEATAMLTGQNVKPPSRVRPSEEARKAYRELVRKAHPDLAQEDAERQRREEFLVRVNKAYADGDTDALHGLLDEWTNGPREAEPEPEVPRSELLYARLEWLAERKEVLVAMVEEMEQSAIGAMLRMAPDDPDRLLEEIAEQLLEQVSERERELARLIQVRDTGDGAAAGQAGAAGSAGAGTEDV